METKSTKQHALSIIGQKPVKMAFATLILGGGLIGGIWAIRKLRANRKKDEKALREAKKIADGSPEGLQAATLLRAMKGPGTNNALVFQTLNSITNWEGVVKSFEVQSKGGNLVDWLREDLSASDFKKASNLIAEIKDRRPEGTEDNPKAGPLVNSGIAGKVILTTKSANILTSPEIAWWGGNVVQSLSSGVLIYGVTTGKRVVSDLGGTYLEFKSRVVEKSQGPADLILYVRESAISLVTPAEGKKMKNAGGKIYTPSLKDLP